MYMLNTLLSVLDAALLVHAYDSAPNVPDGTNFIETKLFENVVSATRLQQSLSRAVETLLPACSRLDFWAETILGHDVVILVLVDQQVRKGSFQELGFSLLALPIFWNSALSKYLYFWSEWQRGDPVITQDMSYESAIPEWMGGWQGGKP